MLSRRPIFILALLSIAAVFAVGVVSLFKLRFASGDIYPEYSSLRADPLGTKAYFEALQGLAGAEAQRHLRALQRLPEGRDATLFFIGVRSDELVQPEPDYRGLDAFVRNGGRLVVTFYPRPSSMAARSGGTNALAARQQRDLGGATPIDLEQKWGFHLATAPLKREKFLFYAPASARSLAGDIVPAELPWHSPLVFTNLSFDWRVIYAREADPVMIERRLGSGTIVLATDSYFASNEALQKERQPLLLAWLAGPRRQFVFDESHLGVTEQPGIAALARRYNLHGGVLALLVLACLFVWKNSVSFVARERPADEAGAVRGRESAAGFIHLLRRSIGREQLLQACLNEWHKTRPLDGRASPRKLEKIRGVVEAHNAAPDPDPIATYNQITGILNKS